MSIKHPTHNGYLVTNMSPINVACQTKYTLGRHPQRGLNGWAEDAMMGQPYLTAFKLMAPGMEWAESKTSLSKGHSLQQKIIVKLFSAFFLFFVPFIQQTSS